MDNHVKNSFGDTGSPYSVYKSNKKDKFLWTYPDCKEDYSTTVNEGSCHVLLFGKSLS